MLIKVFGIWLMVANIAALEPTVFGERCQLYASGRTVHKFEQTCDEVAAEINRQISKSVK